jgi:hypothetical protein
MIQRKPINQSALQEYKGSELQDSYLKFSANFEGQTKVCSKYLDWMLNQ